MLRDDGVWKVMGALLVLKLLRGYITWKFLFYSMCEMGGDNTQMWRYKVTTMIVTYLLLLAEGSILFVIKKYKRSNIDSPQSPSDRVASLVPRALPVQSIAVPTSFAPAWGGVGKSFR